MIDPQKLADTTLDEHIDPAQIDPDLRLDFANADDVPSTPSPQED